MPQVKLPKTPQATMRQTPKISQTRVDGMKTGDNTGSKPSKTPVLAPGSRGGMMGSKTFKMPKPTGMDALRAIKPTPIKK
jgi:hypothetical protein